MINSFVSGILLEFEHDYLGFQKLNILLQSQSKLFIFFKKKKEKENQTLDLKSISARWPLGVEKSFQYSTFST